MPERPPAHDRMSTQPQTRTGHVVDPAVGGDVHKVLVLIEGIGQQIAEYLSSTPLTLNTTVRLRPQPESGSWRIVDLSNTGSSGDIIGPSIAKADPNGDHQTTFGDFPIIAVHPSGRWVITGDYPSNQHFIVWGWDGTQFVFTSDFDTGRTDIFDNYPNGTHLDFNHAGDHLGVGCSTSPYVLAFPFDQVTGTFSAAISNPSTLPDGPCSAPRWSVDLGSGEFLLIGQDTSGGTYSPVLAYAFAAGFGARSVPASAFSAWSGFTGTCVIGYPRNSAASSTRVVVSDNLSLVRSFCFNSGVWDSYAFSSLSLLQFDVTDGPAIPGNPECSEIQPPAGHALVSFTFPVFYLNNPWTCVVVDGPGELKYPVLSPTYGLPSFFPGFFQWHPTKPKLLCTIGFSTSDIRFTVFDFSSDGIISFPERPTSYHMHESEYIPDYPEFICAWHPSGDVIFGVGYGNLKAYRFIAGAPEYARAP